MARFYIESSQGVLEMTVTSSVQVSEPSMITQHPLEAGSDAADHIVNQNRTISFNGLVSTIRRISNDSSGSSADDQRSVEEFIELLTQIRDSRELFTVHYDDRLPPAENCLFKNIDYSSNSSRYRSYDLTVSFEQVRLSERARTVEIRPQTNSNLTAPLSTFSNNTTVSQPSPPDTSFLTGLLGG